MSSRRVPLLAAVHAESESSAFDEAGSNPLDHVLEVASGGRTYQGRLELATGLLFGGTAACWIMPLLLDAPMAVAIGFAKPQLIFSSCATYVGWAGGCAVLGPMGDKIGRLKIIAASGVSLAAGFALTVALLLSPAALAFPALVAARAVSGFGVGGLMSQAFALALESSESARSKSTGVVINLYFCLAVCLLAGFHLLGQTTPSPSPSPLPLP